MVVDVPQQIQNLLELRKIAAHCRGVLESGASAQTRYRLVFELQQRIRELHPGGIDGMFTQMGADYDYDRAARSYVEALDTLVVDIAEALRIEADEQECDVTAERQIAECRELCDIVVHLRKILDSDADAQVRFDLVFGMSPRVRALRPNFEWYDPDTTYEEDARAYVEALEAHVAEIKKALGIET